MNHFSLDEWTRYKLGQVSDTDAFLMSNHLMDCPRCLDLYTSLIDNEDIKAAGKHIPDGFIESVMTAVKKEALKKTGHSKASRRRPGQLARIMAYYTAAAAITLFLTGAGAFDLLLEKSAGWSEFDMEQYRKNERSLQQMEMKWNNQLSHIMQAYDFMDKRGNPNE